MKKIIIAPVIIILLLLGERLLFVNSDKPVIAFQNSEIESSSYGENIELNYQGASTYSEKFLSLKPQVTIEPDLYESTIEESKHLKEYFKKLRLPTPDQYKHLNPVKIPKMDLSKWFPPPVNQNVVHEFSCVAHTLVYGLNTYLKERRLGRDEHIQFYSFNTFDPKSFHEEIMPSHEKYAPSLEKGLISLYVNGALPKEYDNQSGTKDLKQKYAIAGAAKIDKKQISQHKTFSWAPARKKNIGNRFKHLIKRFINDGIPVVIVVNKNIEGYCESGLGSQQDGVWHKVDNKIISGKGGVDRHAMLIIGYDDSKGKKGAYKLYNSLAWNNPNYETGICSNGYGWLCYENILKPLEEMYICYDKPYQDKINTFIQGIYHGKDTIEYENDLTNLKLKLDQSPHLDPLDSLSPIERLKLQPTTLQVVDPIQDHFLSIKKKYPIGFEKHVPEVEVDDKELVKTMCLTLNLKGQLKIWGRFKQSKVQNPLFQLEGYDKEGRKIAFIDVQATSTSDGHFDISYDLNEKLVGILYEIQLTNIEYLAMSKSSKANIIDEAFNTGKTKDLWKLRISENEYDNFMQAMMKMK